MYKIWWGGGGGDRFCCSVVKYNVLDTKGEGVGDFYGNLGTKYRFLCIIKFELTFKTFSKKGWNVK